MINPKSQKLRDALAGDGIVTLPGVYDCVSARAAVQSGFEVVFTSGYSISASTLGLPDYGFMTASEMLYSVSRIANCVEAPLIADIDTGYGNPLNVMRTVGDVVKAGVAGVFLEDQQWPKRCGHMQGKRLISIEEQVEKIRAAVEAKGDSGLLIVARSDARAVEGLDAAISRGRAYAEAGADVVFIEAPESIEELRTIPESFEGTPCLANMIESGRTPFLSSGELCELGFKLVVYPLSALFAATAAYGAIYGDLKSKGTTGALSQSMVTFRDFEPIVELEKYRDLEKKFVV